MGTHAAMETHSAMGVVMSCSGWPSSGRYLRQTSTEWTDPITWKSTKTLNSAKSRWNKFTNSLTLKNMSNLPASPINLTTSLKRSRIFYLCTSVSLFRKNWPCWWSSPTSPSPSCSERPLPVLWTATSRALSAVRLKRTSILATLNRHVRIWLLTFRTMRSPTSWKPSIPKKGWLGI